MLVIGNLELDSKITSAGATDISYGNAATPGLVTVPINIVWSVLDRDEELYIGYSTRIWRISATGVLGVLHRSTRCTRPPICSV